MTHHHHPRLGAAAYRTFPHSVQLGVLRCDPSCRRLGIFIAVYEVAVEIRWARACYGDHGSHRPDRRTA